MFNTYYGGTTNSTNNININSVSGTIVKNYPKSFFIRFHYNSEMARMLFNSDSQTINITKRGDYCRDYKVAKNAVVLQAMIIPDGYLLCEVMWKEDFDEMMNSGVEEVKDEREN